MKLKYKAVMFLTLLIFCVGSVCATDQDPTDPFVKKLIDDNHQLNTKVYNQSIEIKNLTKDVDNKELFIRSVDSSLQYE